MVKSMLAASIAAFLAAGAMSASAATPASAPPAHGSLAAQYAGWAGSPENARSLVTGLRSGSSIMIATREPGQRMSLAGFTPTRAMSEDEVSSALASAKRSLAKLGIHKPSAEQIQAALIGGEVESRGEMVKVQGPVNVGSVALR